MGPTRQARSPRPSRARPISELETPRTIDALSDEDSGVPEKPSIVKRSSPTGGIHLVTGAVTFVDTFAVGIVNPIYPQLVQSGTIGATAYATIMAAANAASLASSTAYGRLSDVYGRRTAIIASTLTATLGYACYIVGYASTEFPLVRLGLPAAGRVIGGMGRTALGPPLLALLSEHSTAGATGQVTARTMATFGFGYAFGSGAGGLAYSLGGTWCNLMLIAGCSCVQVLCAWCLPVEHRRSGAGGAT